MYTDARADAADTVNAELTMVGMNDAVAEQADVVEHWLSRRLFAVLKIMPIMRLQ